MAAAVVKLLESAHPGVEFTRKKYLEAHDVIVASAYYTRTLDIAAGFVNRVCALSVERCLELMWVPDQKSWLVCVLLPGGSRLL